MQSCLKRFLGHKHKHYLSAMCTRFDEGSSSCSVEADSLTIWNPLLVVLVHHGCTARKRCSFLTEQLLCSSDLPPSLSNQSSLVTHRPYFHMKKNFALSVLLDGELLTRARPVCPAPFSQVVAVLPCIMLHPWVACSAFDPPNVLCEQFWLSSDPFLVNFFIGVFSILHVSCAFSFYHRSLMVVLAKNL